MEEYRNRFPSRRNSINPKKWAWEKGEVILFSDFPS